MKKVEAIQLRRIRAKHCLVGIGCLIMLQLLTASCAASGGPKRESNFDAQWRFLRADAPGADEAAFNDSAWPTVDLPHDWSIEDLPPAPTNGTSTAAAPSPTSAPTNSAAPG